MTAKKGLFKKFKNRIFVETGSQEGNAIQQALAERYEVVYSIELLPEWYSKCVARFKNNPNVHLILGDSGEKLATVMELINEPVTLWLDGHIGAESTPIMKELEILKNHSVKTHTILIDDLRDWKTHVNGVNPQMIRMKVLEINPLYAITYEDGATRNCKNDILVASI
jgi:hypothetical protein